MIKSTGRPSFAFLFFNTQNNRTPATVASKSSTITPAATPMTTPSFDIGIAVSEDAEVDVFNVAFVMVWPAESVVPTAISVPDVATWSVLVTAAVMIIFWPDFVLIVCAIP